MLVISFRGLRELSGFPKKDKSYKNYSVIIGVICETFAVMSNISWDTDHDLLRSNNEACIYTYARHTILELAHAKNKNKTKYVIQF